MDNVYPKTPEDFASLAERNRITMLQHSPKPAAVDDIWHRVDGVHRGDDEVYEGMTLSWTTWHCEKTTARGAWFVCTEWRNEPKRFVLTSGARNLHRTNVEALKALIARKKRQLRILKGQKTMAEDTMREAAEALLKLEAYKASEKDRP